MFIDEVKIFASAGHGGKGAVAFHREAYITKGGPSGGNGGRGGDVVLVADHDLNNLIQQFYVPRLIADAGEAGMGKGMDGAAGKDLIIKVPCGTLVWRIAKPLEEVEADPENEVSSKAKVATKADTAPASGGKVPVGTAKRPTIRMAKGVSALEIDLEEEGFDDPIANVRDRGELICDLVENGQRFVLCKAGRGGLGNRNFATSVRQAPRYAQPGEPGDEGEFLFELRMVAEVGLVGYPNAGKSTLLTAISHARPRIAPYPFTTLTPQVGILEYEDWHRLTICDVPGLIAGAHQDVGLGHAFLRHIARCRIIVILLDMAGTDNREPWDDYTSLLQELELYDPALLEKPRLVVANKMDEPAAEAMLKKFKRKITKTPVLPISAAFGQGIPEFRRLIRTAAQAQPPR